MMNGLGFGEIARRQDWHGRCPDPAGEHQVWLTEGTMRILFATDGSGDAKAAAAYLEQLPLTDASRVRIVSVGDRRSSRVDLPLVQAYYDALAEDRKQLVEATRASLSTPAATETCVLEGDARDEIVREAQDWGADLVVMGARGLGAFDALLLGSVSLAVARHAECPVLIVKGHGHRLRQVVVGIDGSAESADAARFAMGLPLDGRHHVDLVGVVEPVHFPATAPFVAHQLLQSAIHAIKEERRAALTKAMDEIAPGFEAHGVAVSRTIPEGHPTEVITALASTSGAGLIVVGARGLGGVQRLVLGSVSESVLRTAPCPVLIVKRRRGA
jgi:nucleotide-binding universal stress UspA family protein